MCLAFANRLIWLLLDIMDLSRIEAGQMEIRQEEVDEVRSQKAPVKHPR